MDQSISSVKILRTVNAIQKKNLPDKIDDKKTHETKPKPTTFDNLLQEVSLLIHCGELLEHFHIRFCPGIKTKRKNDTSTTRSPLDRAKLRCLKPVITSLKESTVN